MGAIWFDQNRLAAYISEVVGYKSGLALNQYEILDKLSSERQFKKHIENNKNNMVRIRSEDIEDIIKLLLNKVGNTSKVQGNPVVDLVLKYTNKPKELKIFSEVMKMFAPESLDQEPKLGSIIIEVTEKYGETGLDILNDIISSIQFVSHISPWTNYRFINWKNVIELNDLFASEKLMPTYGEYIDQRFIDYLYNNFSDIDKINWRKFEQFTAEYFHRLGYKVKLGKGRNDGGIDIRIWECDNSLDDPKLVLIQCKREKRKVGKVVVKALWADVVNENATSGLIVTTTSLAPGAERVCQARAYTIQEANRSTLKKWLREMRTPGKGIFLGE